MLRLFLICGLLAARLSGADGADFSASLSAAEFEAAGLDKLTAAERARLDALVATKAGPREAVVAAPPAKPAAPDILNGRIAGALSGWSEGTVLVFEDGQRWQVVSKGTYRAAPVRRGPKLQLFPLSNGDYIMTVETVPMRAQVRRVAE
jgi:hypothetical protein